MFLVYSKWPEFRTALLVDYRAIYNKHMKSTKALGIAIPQSILLRAERMIE